MITCENITTYIPVHLIAGCDIIHKGRIRIQTSFIYPDGSSIDLFLKETQDSIILTDLGNTVSYLLNILTLSDIRDKEEIITHLCKIFRVHRINGEFMVSVFLTEIVILPEAFLRLVEVLILISDLIKL